MTDLDHVLLVNRVIPGQGVLHGGGAAPEIDAKAPPGVAVDQILGPVLGEAVRDVRRRAGGGGGAAAAAAAAQQMVCWRKLMECRGLVDLHQGGGVIRAIWCPGVILYHNPR